MKKPEGKVAGGALPAGQCTDDVFARKHPNILLYLTDALWDDGKERELSQLTISVRAGAIALALNDKALKQSMYTQADTLTEALKLLEGALADGSGEWRPWNMGKGKKG